MKKIAAQLVLIDLDGTLVDSVPDLSHAVDAMMDDLGLPQRGDQKVRNWVGNGVVRLVKRALTEDLHAEPDTVLFDEAYPIFLKHYAAANGQYSQLYPGVLDGLEYLEKKGCHIGCVTNKAEDFTRPLLKTLRILDKFGVVVSGDTLPQKKPEPEPLLHAAKHFGVAAEQALMVGDSMHDVQAARAAGFAVVAVSYGYNHGVDIRQAKPDHVVDSLAQLSELLA